ncbi:MAG: AAA family ATPase [Promethearchaeota archaeon]
MKLEKIEIKNFKSIKDATVELNNINVLIGSNGAGKTNFIEAFKLLKLIYGLNDNDPFEKWWGYNNVVWRKKEELNINVNLYFRFDKYKINFETEVNGSGGYFHFIKEKLEIEKFLTLIKTRKTISLIYNQEFLKKILSKLANVGIETKFINKIREPQEIENNLTQQQSILNLNYNIDNAYILNKKFDDPHITLLKIPQNYPTLKDSYIYILSPLVNDTILTNNGIDSTQNLFSAILKDLTNFFNYTLITNINFQTLKRPFKPSKDKTTGLDVENIENILYNLFIEKGKIPDLVQYFIQEVFPDSTIQFELTYDSRIILKLKQGDLTFYAPNISQGFYKCLILATLIELSPQIIIIDQIENSIYPKVLSLFIDLIRDRQIQAILSTQSTYLIDIVDPKELIIVNKEDSRSKFIRIKDPEKLKEELNNKKITMSEKWLFGMD